MGGYFPGKKFGGPPVSVDNFCSLVKECVECFIITHNHDKDEKKTYATITEGWNDRSNAKVLYLSDNQYKYATFKCIAKEIKPDVIYLQGLFQMCVFPCLKLAQKEKIRVVLAPRGELCSGAFKKKYKKIPYIAVLRAMGLLKNVEFQSTSEEESMAIGKYLGANSDRIHFLSNIPSMPCDLPPKRIKSSGEGRFIFISRILWKKNLLFAIQILKDIKGKVVFDIYGPKEDDEYWKACEDEIKQLPDNIKVEYKGILGHNEIHKTFNQYDAFLFPTLSENYGHVIAEALVSGCVPIISDQTPWTDMNEASAGWALPLEKEDDFVHAIQDVVDMDDSTINKKRDFIQKYLKEKLKIDELKKEYLNVFK